VHSGIPLTFATFMRHCIAYILLSIAGTLLFPRHELCITHPFGHKPHPPEEYSPCDLHKMYKGGDATWLPPMHCEHASAITSAFPLPQHTSVQPDFQVLFVAVAIFQFIPLIKGTESEKIESPEVRCNSGPPLSANSLRGPPLV
jgi:hypothetical protein